MTAGRASLIVAATLAASLVIAAPARAGRPCEASIPTARAFEQGLALGRRTADALDRSGASVALVARAGQDLSRYGLRYSHLGIVRRDPGDGRWAVLHALNTCGTAASDLFDEGLGNFFLDDPFEYEALVVLLDPATGRRLAAALDGDLPRRFHDARYNAVAYPFSTAYQNSNQWVLEILASTLARDALVDDRTAAQRWLLLAGYRPTTLEIPTLTRLGAGISRANVAFDDHPFDRRIAGHIDVVSVESVVAFVESRGAVARTIVLRLPPPSSSPSSL